MAQCRTAPAPVMYVHPRRFCRDVKQTWMMASKVLVPAKAGNDSAWRCDGQIGQRRCARLVPGCAVWALILRRAQAPPTQATSLRWRSTAAESLLEIYLRD